MEYVGPADSLPPKIKIGKIEKTTNSIHLEVEVTRIEFGDKISYYYKKHTDREYTTYKEGVTDQTIDIEGLVAGETYVIKIVAENENGQTTKETYGIMLGNLEEGTISQKNGPTWIGDGTATLELQTTAVVGYIEYQIVPKDEISGEEDLDDTKWIKYTETITGLKHNEVVFARLTDGTNATEDYLSVEVEDTVEPTVQITKGTVTTKAITTSTVAVTGIKISKSSATIAPNGTTTVYATIEPTDAYNKGVTWKTSDASIAKISSTSTNSRTAITVTGLAAGTATITATAAGNTSKTATCTITVKQPVTEISVSPTSVTLNVGDTKTLTATILPANATNQEKSWGSDTTTVATVDSSGKVTAVAPGTATITVTANDDTNKKAVVIVTVNCKKCNNSGSVKCGNQYTYSRQRIDAYADCSVCDERTTWRTTLSCASCGFSTKRATCASCWGGYDGESYDENEVCTQIVECTHK